MRDQLRQRYDQRDRFYGVFIRFGTKKGYKHLETTTLLTHIMDCNQHDVCDHLWFNFTLEIERLWLDQNLHTGHILSFNARVKQYEKGYASKSIDYKLSHPRNFKIEGKNALLWTLHNCSPPFEIHRKEILDHKYQKSLIPKDDIIVSDIKRIIKKPLKLDDFVKR